MPDELVFYTNPMSRGRIVRWMLEEIGQPYRTEIIEYGPPMKSPDYLAINPMGKVPALRHGDAVVTETGAICAYLADAFPRGGTGAAPRQPRARSLLPLAVLRARVPLEAPSSTRASASSACPRGAAWSATARSDVVLDALEKAVSASGISRGASFTAADLYLGAQIGWGMQFGTLEKRPAFEAYWNRIKDRPAAIRAREIDDALLPKKEYAGHIRLKHRRSPDVALSAFSWGDKAFRG